MPDIEVVIFVLILAATFPTVGFYFDWKAKKKKAEERHKERMKSDSEAQ